MSTVKTQAVVDKTVEISYDGDPSAVWGWDDIQGNTASAKLGGDAPTWRDYAYGIGGGVLFKALGFALADELYMTVQTSHGVALNQILYEHIHFTPASDGTGKKFKFQLDVIAAGINGVWAVPTGSPFVGEKTMASDLSGTHSVLGFEDIPAVNTTVSTLYKMKLTRIAASVVEDEFDGEVFVEFMDGHVKRDQGRGSRQEYIK